MGTRAVKSLGYAGLIPFLGIGAAIASGRLGIHLQPAQEAINLYAALIVSFLGAVHWGLHIEKMSIKTDESPSLPFAWGITPSLWAWFSLLLLSPLGATLSLAVCLLVVWCVDRTRLPAQGAWQEYHTLRNHLTAGAIMGLLLASAGTLWR